MSERRSPKVLFEDYLAASKLLQLATTHTSQPWVCSVWYAFERQEGLVVFLSQNTRRHVLELLENPLVACSVVDMPLEGLGQKVRGLSFEGAVAPATRENISDWYRWYEARWPQVRDLTPLESMHPSAPGPWLYGIRLQGGVLFDEVNFSSSPRQEWRRAD